MAAVLSREIKIVEILVQNEHTDLNCRDPETRVTSLWLAGYLGEGEMIKLLAENGADVYATNRDGVNVLHMAAALGQANVFKMLLESFFDPLRETKDGMIALHIACIENRQEVISCYVDFMN